MANSRGPEGKAAVAALLAICWIFVGLRVYVRTCVVKAFGLDDWLLLTALVMYTTHCACGLASIAHGVGQHVVPKDELSSALYAWWLATLFYILTTVFIRASIAVFLNKLCVKKVHKLIIWTTMGIVVTYSTFYFVLSIVQCNPPKLFWEKFSNVQGKCLDPTIFPYATYVHSAVSAVADWILGLLPLWLIKDLQMNFRTKVSVCTILGLGIIAGVAAIIRIPYVRIAGHTDEFLYAVIDVSLWSLAEASLGIIAASASALRPLFKHFYELSNYGSRTAASRPSHLRYPPHNAYIRNKSNGTNRDIERDTELDSINKADGMEPRHGVGNETSAVGGFVMSESKLDIGSMSGSEEHLTGAGGSGKDIFVHTVIQVDSNRNQENGTWRDPER